MIRMVRDVCVKPLATPFRRHSVSPRLLQSPGGIGRIAFGGGAGKIFRQTPMNTLMLFYIGVPLLAVVAGLLSRLNNETVTRIFNILMLAAVIAGAVYVLAGHRGWMHILSFIGLTIIGNLAGVFIAGWGRK